MSRSDIDSYIETSQPRRHFSLIDSFRRTLPADRCNCNFAFNELTEYNAEKYNNDLSE